MSYKFLKQKIPTAFAMRLLNDVCQQTSGMEMLLLTPVSLILLNILNSFSAIATVGFQATLVKMLYGALNSNMCPIIQSTKNHARENDAINLSYF